MERLTYETLVPRLLENVPEFPGDTDWVSERLTYLVFGDLMRFVNSLLESRTHEDVLSRTFNFIEEAAKTGDTEIEALLRDSLEELLTRNPDSARDHMGNATRTIFRKVEKEVYRGV